MRASFEQNPEAAQALVDTGNRQLTHRQASARRGVDWRVEFPRILTKIRSELAAPTEAAPTKPKFAGADVQKAAWQDAPIFELGRRATIKTATLHSGGAVGADTVWGTIGKQYGMLLENIKHYWLKGGPKPPQGNVLLTEEQKAEARPNVRQAAASMRERGDTTRSAPTNSSAISFIHRNWFQVKNSDAVFAIIRGGFNPTRTLIDIKTDRGTPWAVEMGINEGKPVYVFSQKLTPFLLPPLSLP